MSVVTGIALVTSLWTHHDREQPDGSWIVIRDVIDEIQSWLREHCNGLQLLEVADHAGGGKHPQFQAWLGGGNYMAEMEDALGEFVATRDWPYPENVVLILKPEDGPTKVFRPHFEPPLS